MHSTMVATHILCHPPTPSQILGRSASRQDVVRRFWAWDGSARLVDPEAQSLVLSTRRALIQLRHVLLVAWVITVDECDHLRRCHRAFPARASTLLRMLAPVVHILGRERLHHKKRIELRVDLVEPGQVLVHQRQGWRRLHSVGCLEPKAPALEEDQVHRSCDRWPAAHWRAVALPRVRALVVARHLCRLSRLERAQLRQRLAHQPHVVRARLTAAV
mmetsp:Transcript_35501/g.82908  ORF Transcript_35501/g.82908 Transcript_35501/m.82908 type:complete len:217 (+) Transcript_35501:114-764(+)